MRVRAVWQDQVLAESEATIYLEGNHYFPPDSLNREFFNPSGHHSTCFWKGVANYYDLDVEGAHNDAAAWFYPEPNQAAQQIRGYIAFWKGVKVEAVEEPSSDVSS